MGEALRGEVHAAEDRPRMVHEVAADDVVLVSDALRVAVARREQERLAELFGKLEWNADYDYKLERSRR